jgi:hypothetical protein
LVPGVAAAVWVLPITSVSRLVGPTGNGISAVSVAGPVCALVAERVQAVADSPTIRVKMSRTKIFFFIGGSPFDCWQTRPKLLGCLPEKKFVN